MKTSYNIDCKRGSRIVACALLFSIGCIAITLKAQLTPVPDHFTDWTGARSDKYNDPGNWSTGVVPEGVDVAIRLRGDPSISNKHIVLNYDGATPKRLQLYSIQTGASKAYTLELINSGTHWLELNPVGRGFVFNGAIGNSMGSANDITMPNTKGDASNRLGMNVILNSYTRVTLDGSTAGIRGNNAATGLGQAVFTLKGNAQMELAQAGNIPFVWSGSPSPFSASDRLYIGGLQTDPHTTIYVGNQSVSINSLISQGETSLMSGLFYCSPTSPGAECDVFGGVTRMTGDVIFRGRGDAVFRLRDQAQYIVDGTHEGNITLMDRSTLGGIGTISGNITVGSSGQLTPGGKGTASGVPLTINGNVNLSGNLSFDMATATVYDRLDITGTLSIRSPAHPTLPGTANLVIGVANTFPLVSGAYALMTVTAPGPGSSIEGDFTDSNFAPAASMSIKTSWGWDIGTAASGFEKRTLLLTFEQKRFGSVAGLTGRFSKAADVVDQVYLLSINNNTLHDAYEPLFNSLNRQPSLELYQEVLNQLTPSTYQAWFPSAIVRTNSLIQSLEDRMYQDAAFGRKKGTFQMFLEGYRQEASRGKNDDASYSNYGIIGTVVGGDYVFGENFVVGGFVGYDYTDFDLDTAGGTSEVSSITLGLKGRYKKGRLRINLTGFYGADDYESRRTVALTGLGTWADSDTKGTRLGAAASLAYTFQLPWFEVIPVAGVQVLDWKVDAFQERNANEASLYIYEQNQMSLQGKLGIRIARSFPLRYGFIRPFFHYSQMYELEKNERWIRSELFGNRTSTMAPATNTDGWRMDIGIDWSATRRLRVELRYNSEYRGAASESVGVRGGVNYTF